MYTSKQPCSFLGLKQILEQKRARNLAENRFSSCIQQQTDQIEKMDLNVLLKRGRESKKSKGSFPALKDRGELSGHHWKRMKLRFLEPALNLFEKVLVPSSYPEEPEVDEEGDEDDILDEVS